MAGKLVIESTLNSDPNTLPFGLYNPDTEGKLTWHCGPSIEGKDIVSVFSMKGETERDVRYLESLDQAKYMRTELLKAGWLLIKPPNVEVKTANKGKGKEKEKK